MLATPPRAGLRAVQTPQAFAFPLILEAHRRAAAAGVDDLTDDVAVAEWAGAPAYVFEGDPAEPQGDDDAGYERRRGAAYGRTRARPGSARVSTSTPSRPATTSGCAASRSPHPGAERPFRRRRRLARARRRDLRRARRGRHRRPFPALRPAMEGAASQVFLAHAAERVRARGGFIVHLDATLICEAPKIGPHREAMRARVAEIAGLDIAASRSRRRPPKASALPAAARGSPAWRRRRCGCLDRLR